MRSKRRDLPASLAGSQRRQAGARGERRGKSGTVPRPVKWGLSPNNKGFSLAEVSVAAVILAVSLLAIYGIYIRTYQASGRAEKKEVARALAQQTMENVINRPFANITLWALSDPAPPTTYTYQNKDGSQVTESIIRTSSGSQSNYATYQQTQIKLGIVFTITTLISWRDDDNDQLAPTDPDPQDYKRVHVTVSWPGNNSPVVLDRFVSMYFRPYANSTATADGGKFQLNDNTNWASLGTTEISTYSGGNKTANSEAKGFSTYTYNTSPDVAWVSRFTDDDAGAEYPDSADASSTDNTFTNDPINFNTGAVSTAQISVAATANALDNNPNWHVGDIGEAVTIWPDWVQASPNITWPTTPAWSTTWRQPSAIAKSTLTGGFSWDYVPVIPPDKAFNLFSVASSYAGSKSVITSDTADNKIVSRSWTKINDVRIVERPGAPSGLINIGTVEAGVQAQANGSSGGSKAEVTWRLLNFSYYDNTGTRQTILVDSQDDIPAITGFSSETQQVLANVDPIIVGTNQTSVTDNNADAEVVAIVIKTKAATFNFNDGVAWQITVPAATITLGTVEANVSYTTM